MTATHTHRCPQCRIDGKPAVRYPTLYQSGTFADKVYWIQCKVCGLTGPKETEKDLARPSWNRLYRKMVDDADLAPSQPRRTGARH